MSLWSRMWRHTTLEPNRHYRRSLARLTRPQRAEIHRIIADLKRLPLADRAVVVALLPEWQQNLIERHL